MAFSTGLPHWLIILCESPLKRKQRGKVQFRKGWPLFFEFYLPKMAFICETKILEEIFKK